MLAPDSVANIRAVLDEDAHALPVWAVRALRLLLDERECLVAGLLGLEAGEEVAGCRRRLALARQMLLEWEGTLDKVPDAPEGSNAHAYGLGHIRAVRSCIYDLRTVLEGKV